MENLSLLVILMLTQILKLNLQKLSLMKWLVVILLKLQVNKKFLGDKADYVLANPNGISVEGGGFINTPRASLVVGKPQVSAGNLNGYDVTGDKGLNTNGKITTSGDIDLIAPQVNVAGQISTSEGVNVIAGKIKLLEKITVH